MDNKQLLAEALDYAIKHQTFNKVVKVQRAKNVCCFGLGTYFKEAFVSNTCRRSGMSIFCPITTIPNGVKLFAGFPACRRRN